MIDNIRCSRKFILVPNHQHAVTGGNEVGLEGIRPHGNSEQEGGAGVLRPISAGSTMGNHHWIH